MAAGVAIRRGIAAQRRAACLAGPEVDPGATRLHTRFADAHVRLLHCRDSRDVRTCRDHAQTPRQREAGSERIANRFMLRRGPVEVMNSSMDHSPLYRPRPLLFSPPNGQSGRSSPPTRTRGSCRPGRRSRERRDSNVDGYNEIRYICRVCGRLRQARAVGLPPTRSTS
jgi:hypothetical protein